MAAVRDRSSRLPCASQGLRPAAAPCSLCQGPRCGTGATGCKHRLTRVSHPLWLGPAGAPAAGCGADARAGRAGAWQQPAGSEVLVNSLRGRACKGAAPPNKHVSRSRAFHVRLWPRVAQRFRGSTCHRFSPKGTSPVVTSPVRRCAAAPLQPCAQCVMLIYRLFGGSVNQGVPGQGGNMFDYTGPRGLKVRTESKGNSPASISVPGCTASGC